MELNKTYFAHSTHSNKNYASEIVFESDNENKRRSLAKFSNKRRRFVSGRTKFSSGSIYYCYTNKACEVRVSDNTMGNNDLTY